jgi:serine protease Do
LPQLRQGKVIRGRIGVSVTAVPREGYEDFGLKSRMGAIVASVSQGGAAQKAGMEPGDVVVQFNGRPVPNRDELVAMVVATKPGTSVPIKVMRNHQEKTLNVTVEELDLDAEQNNGRPRSTQNNPDQPEEHGASGFGLTLENVTPAMARRLSIPSGQRGAVITDVDPDGPAAGALRPGDVILSVNRKTVASAQEAAEELKKVQSGHLAQMIVWRGTGETFVTVKKD